MRGIVPLVAHPGQVRWGTQATGSPASHPPHPAAAPTAQRPPTGARDSNLVALGVGRLAHQDRSPWGRWVWTNSSSSAKTLIHPPRHQNILLRDPRPAKWFTTAVMTDAADESMCSTSNRASLDQTEGVEVPGLRHRPAAAAHRDRQGNMLSFTPCPAPAGRPGSSSPSSSRSSSSARSPSSAGASPSPGCAQPSCPRPPSSASEPRSP